MIPVRVTYTYIHHVFTCNCFHQVHLCPSEEGTGPALVNDNTHTTHQSTSFPSFAIWFFGFSNLQINFYTRKSSHPHTVASRMFVQTALLLTLTHVAYGAPCPTATANAQGETPTNFSPVSDTCTCGTATCRDFADDNNRICNAGLNTCSDWPTCSNTDNSATLVTPDASSLGTSFDFVNARPSCKCGERYCRQDNDYPNGNAGPGGVTPAGPAHMYCNAVTSECTLKACDNTDGTVLNSERCQCGKDHCRIHSDAKPRATNGYYCNAANNMCGITKDINRFSATVPREPGTFGPDRGPAAANFFTKCSDVPGNVVVMDADDCFEAATAKGVAFQAQTSSAYPSGCWWGSHGTGGSENSKDAGNNHEGSTFLNFNTASKKFGADETMFSMICKSGTLCQNTDGSATNTDACVCGSVECFPGSTCESSTSLCTLVNQAEKIAEIETNQKTCCSKNAALEAEIALLKKQYEGINEMCKTTSSDGRRLATAAGCGGGASLSNTPDTPDGLGPGAIAAIVIVPIVVLLGCAGAYMYVQRQQSEKKNPEKMYELKDFAPKEATAELFDQRGSMNSNNPLADAGIASGTNPMMQQDELQIASGTNPMAHVPRQQQQQQQQPQQQQPQQQKDELQVDIGSTTEELPLPLNWEEISGANDGDPRYYWNTETDETQFERPL